MSEVGPGAWPLASRTGLPDEFAYLRRAFPRERWSTGLHPTAAFWLQMHGGFRRHNAQMQALTGQWRSGQIDLRALHDRLLPLLGGFLQHLDGHHWIETGHYFPQFRRIEPRVEAGLDLLDRDHDAVHAHLEALAAAGRAMHVAVANAAPDAADQASRLADCVDATARPLLRHLEDEEDIVIPLISLRVAPHD